MRPLLPPKAPPGRDAALERLAATRWDLVVVGGGASGASVAREASLRGLSVALVEQDDLASGTSSRSSRLIHGGLRYLAQGDFALVREGLQERGRLLRTAPGLVWPVRFLYPVYRGDPDGPSRVGLGLWLYDLLSFGDGLGRHRRWTAGHVHRALPQLRATGLRAGFVYGDAATHDARLVLGLALAAAAQGALVATRCRVVKWTRTGQEIEVEIEDRLGRRAVTAGTRALLFACGPWTEGVPGAATLRRARGAHIAFPAGRLPLTMHVALRSPDDGRLAFGMPIGGYTVFGTTDDEDPEDPHGVRATPGDVAYLLKVAGHAFPHARLVASDITGLWAGVRPLLDDPDAPDPDALSRRHRVLEAEPGVVVLQGGKLTTHHRMAEDALALVTRGRSEPPRERPLLAGSLADGRRALQGLGVGERDIADLASLYGARLAHLAERVARSGEAGDLESRILLAQIEIAVDEEWAWSLDDLLLRRLLPGALNLRLCARLAPWAADVLADRLGWSPRERDDHLREFNSAVRDELRAVRSEGVER